MKTKVSLAVKILNQLEINRDSDDVFLSPEELAAKIYGEELFSTNTAKFREMQDELINGIRQNMGHARALADENGMMIIPRRKLSKSSGKKFRILGWKIFTNGDEEFLVDELMYKKNKSESFDHSSRKLIETAQKEGVLSEKEVKKLKGD